MDNRTPPITETTATTPARPTQNRDAGRARVARAISHLLRIGYDALSPEEAARMAAEGDKLVAPRKTRQHHT